MKSFATTVNSFLCPVFAVVCWAPYLLFRMDTISDGKFNLTDFVVDSVIICLILFTEFHIAAAKKLPPEVFFKNSQAKRLCQSLFSDKVAGL